MFGTRCCLLFDSRYCKLHVSIAFGAYVTVGNMPSPWFQPSGVPFLSVVDIGPCSQLFIILDIVQGKASIETSLRWNGDGLKMTDGYCLILDYWHHSYEDYHLPDRHSEDLS